jgi:uncharacterized protein (TIGR00369 family)
MSELSLRDDRMCFACGEENPDGLGLKFACEGDEVVTRFVFPKKFQGYRDVVHGGLISTVLDEAMVTLVNEMGRLAVTAELTVRFLKPLHVGEPLEVRARLTEKRGRVYMVEGWASLEDATEIARGQARCIDMGPLPPRDGDRRSAPEGTAPAEGERR